MVQEKDAVGEVKNILEMRMDKIRFVFGTDDKKKIKKTHFGDSKFFHIYDVFENGDFDLIEVKENAAKEEDEVHGGKHKMQMVLKLLKGTDIIIGRIPSPNFKNISLKTNFQPIIINEEEIDNLVQVINKSYSEICVMISDRKNGKREDKLLILK